MNLPFGIGNVEYDEGDEELAQRIVDALPHGGGINYEWNIEFYYENEKGWIDASNIFDAMDENGSYCHAFPFTARFTRDLELEDLVFDFNPDDYECCGYGLGDYLEELLSNMKEDDDDTSRV